MSAPPVAETLAAAAERLPLTGRLIAIDLGEVRIGVALSDAGQVLASPAETLEVPRNQDDPALRAMVDALARHEAAGVVVGYPRQLDGSEGKPAARARRLAGVLEQRTGLPTVLIDERFTTTEAERVMLAQDASRAERRRSIDRVAASLLLQTVLEVQRTRRRVQAEAAAEAADEAVAAEAADEAVAEPDADPPAPAPKDDRWH